MSLGDKIRKRFSSLGRSPIAIALAVIALYGILYAIFSLIDTTEALLEFFDRYEVIEADEAVLAGLVVFFLLTVVGYWEVRRRSAALQQSRNLLGTALDSLKDGAALFDKDERLVMFNKGYVAASPALRDFVKPGVSITEIVKHLTEKGVYGGGDRGWIDERLRQFRALETVEVRLRDPDGKERWAILRTYRTGDGGTFLIREDITERKQAEAELITVRQRLADAIDSISDGVALFDKDERLVMYNQSYYLVVSRVIGDFRLGMTFEDEIQSLYRRGFYIDRGDGWIAERLRAFRALEAIEYRARDVLGRECWIKVHHYRTRDGGTLLIREDVTDRRKAESELRASERLLALFIEHAPAALAMLDRDMRYLHVSRRWLIDYGFGNQDLRGVSHYDVIPNIPAPWKIDHRRALAGDVIRVEADSYERPDGSVRWLKRELRPWFDAAGDIGGIIIFTEDITASRKAEADLESSRDLLQTAIDSMPGGAALYDKDERLVLWNANYVASHPQLGDIIKPGALFESVVAELTSRGGYGTSDPDWVSKRVRAFRALEPLEVHMRLPDGEERWALTNQYRTRDGGTFLVRTDITERKKAEADLESSRQLLQSALDSVADGVALFDKDERLVMWNTNYVSTREQLRGFIQPGRPFAELIGHLVKSGGYVAADETWVNERIRRFRALESFEAHMRDPDGSERWSLINHYRTRDGGTFLVRADITDRKKAEVALKTSQQLLRTALDSIESGAALFDKDERLVLYNKGYHLGVLRLVDEFHIGMKFEDETRRLDRKGYYTHARGKEWIAERLRAFRTLEPIEYRARDALGHDIWIKVNHYRTEDGGTLLIREDITARKRMEEQLRSTQGLLLTALESMNDGVALFDRNERLVLFNQEFARYPTTMRDIVKIGISFAELIEKVFETGGYIGKNRDWLEHRLGSFRALKPIEVVFRDADGSNRWFNFTHHRTRDGGTLMVREDVSDQMRALGEVEHARNIAEQANESKTKFLASMSHELRTPLNAILGFAQLIELGIGKMPEEQTREYLSIVLKSGQHLLDLLSNILEFAKYEVQGEYRAFVSMSSVDLSLQCVDMVREEAKARGVTIVNRAGNKENELRFIGDPLWARQILLNLLVNAVKYNHPEGTATVTCTRGANGRVRIAVADTGMGIPDDLHDRVFEPFQRLGREGGQIEGAGVGLALARQLVLRMGGEIGFESAPGKGSTFWFDLPVVEDEIGQVA